jgi:hypothetical protein
MQSDPNSLVRKQFLITRSQVEKLEKLAGGVGISATEVLRRAIDAYAPARTTTDMEAPELLNLLQSRLKEAIDTAKAASIAVGSSTGEKASQ